MVYNPYIKFKQESVYFQKATLRWAARRRMNDIQYGMAV
jgi:hypothetical protein